MNRDNWYAILGMPTPIARKKAVFSCTTNGSAGLSATDSTKSGLRNWRVALKNWLGNSGGGGGPGGGAGHAARAVAQAPAVPALQPPHPLRALPPILVVDNQADGAPVLIGERLSVPPVGEQDVLAHQVLEAQARRVPLAALDPHAHGGGAGAPLARHGAG